MYDNNNNYPNDNPYQNQNTNQNMNQSHNIYGDNVYGQHTVSNPYENSTASYQYGNTYPDSYAQINQNAGLEQSVNMNRNKKAQSEKTTRGGFLKKALVSVSLGLLFGVFAGLGIFAVQSVTSRIGDNTDGSNVSLEAVGEEVLNESDKSGIDAYSSDNLVQAESGIRVTDSITTVVSDVSDVVTEVMPAIVSIDNHYTEKMSFFGQYIINEADASGSGIIVGQNDTELLIVTNYHVIADTEKLTVQFVEGSEAEASVKGTDADMDLAVIAVPLTKIDSETLQEIAVATLGDSDSLKVGEPAIAIGNSLGYGQSVTTGVISALNRSIQLSDGSDGTFIQTDAAINPGNSGGALLNVKGEVIGINSNKIGGSAIEGMGYAIPISSASPIIAELMLKETKNKVAEDERGYLGITGITVTEDVSEPYGIPEGVFITRVYDNTAAAAAGLQKGDIITRINGEEITSMDELQKELEFHSSGETVELTIMSASSNGYVSRQVELTLGNKVQN